MLPMMGNLNFSCEYALYIRKIHIAKIARPKIGNIINPRNPMIGMCAKISSMIHSAIQKGKIQMLNAIDWAA